MKEKDKNNYYKYDIIKYFSVDHIKSIWFVYDKLRPAWTYSMRCNQQSINCVTVGSMVASYVFASITNNINPSTL